MPDTPDRFSALFADLEAQLAAEDRRERLAQVPDLVRESLSDLTLRDRLCAAVGLAVEVDAGGARYAGELEQVGRDWLLIDCGGAVLVALSAVQSLGIGARGHAAGGVLQALGLGSPLRRFQEDGARVRAQLSDGGFLEGTVAGVAADYVELRVGRRNVVVPFSALAIVRAV